MRSQALVLGALVGASACFSGAAQAQTTPTIPAVEPVRDWRVGLRAEAYYDSNVPRLNKNFPSTRGLEREDYIFTPAATVSLVQPIGRQAIFLNGDAGYTFYRENSELDRLSADITGGFAAVIGNSCKQVTFGTYNAAQADLATLDARTTSNLRETETVAAGLTCARPVGPGASVLVQRANSKNSADTVKESDSTVEALVAILNYGRPSLGTLSFGFNYTSAEYPNRIIPGRPVGDGFFTQAYTVGYQREFGEKLSVSVNGGISHSKREFAPEGIDQSFNSTVYALDVLYGLGERIEFEVHAAQAVIPSQQVGKTYDKRQSAEGRVRYQAGQRVTLSAGYSWADTESNVDTASVLLSVTDSQLDAVFGAVEFHPNETLSFQLDVRYEEREANLPQFTYSTTRVGIRAQATF